MSIASNSRTTATVKASRTITSIEGTDGRFEWYQYNDDLRIIHDRETDMFNMNSIAKALNINTKNIARWLTNKDTIRYMSGFTNLLKFEEVRDLTMEVPQSGTVKDIRGKYLHRLLINRFAGDICPEYAYKIALLLDDHFELQRKVEENRALEDKNKSLEEKVDELLSNNRKILADNQELLRINKDQSAKLDDMSYRLKKTYATVQSIADLPEKLNNNVSSGNTIENVYIYTLPDECDDETMIIHLAARTDQSLKQLKSKLPDDHTVINHFTIANAKDCIREIIGEAESYGIVSSVRPTYSISIATEELDTFKSAIEVILRKLNRSPKIVKRTVEITNKVNPFEYISKEWNIDEATINDILKVHSITVDQLLSIVNGTLNYKRNGKEYTVKFYKKSPYLTYGKQIDESIKWFFIKAGAIKDAIKDSK